MLVPSFFVMYCRQHNEDVRAFTVHGIWRQREVVCYKRISMFSITHSSLFCECLLSDSKCRPQV